MLYFGQEMFCGEKQDKIKNIKQYLWNTNLPNLLRDN